MPVHLPAISRRRFIRSCVAAGAGLALGPRFLDAADPAATAAVFRAADPHVWAMLADTHIAADPARLGRGCNMTDHLNHVCREIQIGRASCRERVEDCEVGGPLEKK